MTREDRLRLARLYKRNQLTSALLKARGVDGEVFPKAFGEASQHDQLEPVIARSRDVDADVVEQKSAPNDQRKAGGREIDRSALGEKETAPGAGHG